MDVVLTFSGQDVMYKEVNCTSITLVPKVTIPRSVKEFRPIVYCTKFYKVISKILTMRIKKVMTKIVNNAQSGFILGR